MLLNVPRVDQFGEIFHLQSVIGHLKSRGEKNSAFRCFKKLYSECKTQQATPEASAAIRRLRMSRPKMNAKLALLCLQK